MRCVRIVLKINYRMFSDSAVSTDDPQATILYDRKRQPTDLEDQHGTALRIMSMNRPLRVDGMIFLDEDHNDHPFRCSNYFFID